MITSQKKRKKLQSKSSAGLHKCVNEIVSKADTCFAIRTQDVLKYANPVIRIGVF